MLKKLLLMFSIFAMSTQSDLNAISFGGVKSGASSAFKNFGRKTKDLCWKNGKRKAATAISVFVAGYTILAGLRTYFHNLGFFDMFVKTGTHPIEMFKYDGLYLNAKRLRFFDSEVDKANELVESACAALFATEMNFLPSIENITYNNTGKKMLEKYNNLPADSFVSSKELKRLADQIIRQKDLVQDEKLVELAESFNKEYEILFDNLNLPINKAYFDLAKKRDGIKSMPKLPFCCASTGDDD